MRVTKECVIENLLKREGTVIITNDDHGDYFPFYDKVVIQAQCGSDIATVVLNDDGEVLVQKIDKVKQV